VDRAVVTVTFSAGRGGTVQPGGPVTFDFGVYGYLNGDLYDCLVNGGRGSVTAAVFVRRRVPRRLWSSLGRCPIGRWWCRR
jgi:hypothetical protein